MSSGPRTVDPDRIGDDHADPDWLERNARPLRMKQRLGTDSWDRAKEGRREADVEPVEHGAEDLFDVELPDGDRHLALLVRGEDKGFVGACSCEGYNYNGYCAHLLVLGQLDVTDGIVRRQDMRAAALAKDREPAGADDDVEQREVVDVDEVDQENSDEVLDEDRHGSGADHADPPTPSDTAPVESTSEVTPQGEPAENPVPAGDSPRAPATPSDPFAKELATDVPERYVMRLGGEPYIRRAGYAAIARQADLRIEVEEVEPASATGWEYARYRARVRDPTGEVLAEEVGTSRLECEDLAGAEGELDELAATRAARRALEWATGAGSTLKQ